MGIQEAETTAARRRGGAAPWIPTLIILAAIGLLYWGVLAKLVRDWAVDENYSHGFLIVPIALYFVWERRHRLTALPLAPSNAGLIVVLTGVAILGAGVLGAELFLQRISLLLVLAGAIVFMSGWAYLRALALPLLFLLLMIPIPAIVFNQVAFPLQLLASRSGEAALIAAGVPVLREGNVIALSTTTLQVAEACSGIRSLISLLTLAIVYGYFTLQRVPARVLLALAALPVAIAANGVRVAGTGLAAHYLGAEAAEGFFHTFSGWLVFVLAFVLLFVARIAISYILPEPAGPSTAAKNRKRSVGRPLLPPVVLGRSLVVAAALVVGAVAIAGASVTEPVLPRETFATFPFEVGEWRGQSAMRFDQQVLTVLGVDEYVNRLYVAQDDRLVGLYVGFYASQRQGDTIHSPLNCLPGAGWEPVSRARLTLPLTAGGQRPQPGQGVELNRLLIRKGSDRQLVLYWYQGHGRVVASEYWGKIYTVLDAIRMNRTDGALVRILSPVMGTDAASEEKAEADAVLFAQALFPVLDRYLPD